MSWKDNVIGSYVNKSQPVFRIVNYNHLFSSLKTNESYFTWPPKWPDKYDSIFFKTPFIDDAGSPPCGHATFDNTYCQCWCEKESESDAMWRLYSNEVDVPQLGNTKHFIGLMVVSELGKIMKSLWDEKDKFNRFRYFCGKIKYVNQKQFHDQLFFNNEIGGFYDLYNNSDHRPLMQTLLYKTKAYDHEHEIRFIYWNSDLPDRSDGVLLKHGPSYADIISKIVIDPRAKDAFYQYICDEVHKINPKIIVAKSEMTQKLPQNYLLTGVDKMNKPYIPSSNNKKGNKSGGGNRNASFTDA